MPKPISASPPMNWIIAVRFDGARRFDAKPGTERDQSVAQHRKSLCRRNAAKPLNCARGMHRTDRSDRRCDQDTYQDAGPG